VSCAIVSNNISDSELRDALNNAVRNGIGERLGNWNVVIYQAPDFPELAVRIEGPKGLRWSWTFRKNEQAPDFIQSRIAMGLTDQLAVRDESR
jgi:hypothetical protein